MVQISDLYGIRVVVMLTLQNDNAFRKVRLAGATEAVAIVFGAGCDAMAPNFFGTKVHTTSK